MKGDYNKAEEAIILSVNTNAGKSRGMFTYWASLIQGYVKILNGKYNEAEIALYNTIEASEMINDQHLKLTTLLAFGAVSLNKNEIEKDLIYFMEQAFY
ncbi:MAG: hypothetical protein ACR2GN_06155 [Bacteroidia bacterium]